MMHVAQIEYLSKNNYDTWKMQMQAVLVLNEQWLYVNDTKTRLQIEADVPMWELADQKAKADIILSISPSELCHVKHCQTSRDVWVKLEETYLKLNEMNVEIANDLVTILLLYSTDQPDKMENTLYISKLSTNFIKQKTTALSSTEAEYMSLPEPTKGAVYLRSMLRELGVTSLKANETIIYCDNQDAQALIKNSTHHSRTKHIDIKYHFVREKYECGEIDVKYTPSENMYADILTKSTVKLIHIKCMQGMGTAQT
ncbi:COPIA protein, partial [Acromyrmex heyeri]